MKRKKTLAAILYKSIRLNRMFMCRNGVKVQFICNVHKIMANQQMCGVLTRVFMLE